MKHIIWSNEYEAIRSLVDDLASEYVELDDLDERDLWAEAYLTSDEYLCDEIAELGDLWTDDEIIAIGDLGLWNGRVSGYKELNTKQISDCLTEWSGCDYITFYVDQYKNLRSSGYHHDGRNSALFRAWKPGLSYVQKDNFLDKIYRGKVTSRDITRYTTRIGDQISAVYGW